MTRTVAVGALLAAVGLAVAGCGQSPWQHSLRDYEGATVKDPDSVTLWNNVDQHPNIARVCLDGVAFATTTRPDFSAVQRVPGWDHVCEAVAGRGGVNR